MPVISQADSHQIPRLKSARRKRSKKALDFLLTLGLLDLEFIFPLYLRGPHRVDRWQSDEILNLQENLHFQGRLKHIEVKFHS